MANSASSVPSRRAAIYCRISSEERDKPGLSIPSQLDTLRLQARANGLHVVAEYVDSDVSGGTPMSDRPNGSKLCASVLAGELQAVIATRTDRMFRDTVDCLRTESVWREHGCSLVLLDIGGQYLDTGSAIGQIILTMAVGFAQFERQRDSERVTDVHAFQRRSGIYRSGRVPYGYRTEPRDLGGRQTTHYLIDPTTMAVVLRCYREAALGYSVARIARGLSEDGIPSARGGHAWQPFAVECLLRSRVYMGMLANRRYTEPVEAVNVEAAVGPDLWQAVQAQLGEMRRRPTRQRNGAPLAGLLWCAVCQAPHYLSGMSTGRRYYRCREARFGGACAELSIREEVVYATVLPELIDQLDPARVRARSKRLTTEARRRQARLDTINRQLLRWHETYSHEDSRMSPAEYAQVTGPLIEERDALLAAGRPADPVPPGGTRSGLLRDLQRRDPDALRHALRSMVSRIHIAGSEVVRIDWR